MMIHRLGYILALLLLGGCGDTSTSSVDANQSGPPDAASLTLELQQIKTFHFTWTHVPGATHYRLLESRDGTADFELVAEENEGESVDLIVPLHARVNAKYILQSCNESGCSDSEPVPVAGTLAAAIGYLKASNADMDDHFGGTIALSEDGRTLAIGASKAVMQRELMEAKRIIRFFGQVRSMCFL